MLVFGFEEAEAQRLDHFLVTQLPDHSRSFLQKLIKEGMVRVDGKAVTKNGYKLDDGMEVEVRIPPPAPSDLVPEKIALDILYEDERVIVVNKAPGMVVHPAAGHDSGTLVHAVLGHAPDIEGIGGERRPGLVHRLDKDTSGVIILAKDDQAHRFLQAQFKQREVEKYYLALVNGSPPTPTGRVETPIGRDPKNRKRMAVVAEGKGREALSEYRTVESYKQHSLLEVKILTGRTHQIRVHMAFLKCPVVGDALYGLRKDELGAGRQMLHAARLSLQLPGEEEARVFEAAMPEDFAVVLEGLRVV